MDVGIKEDESPGVCCVHCHHHWFFVPALSNAVMLRLLSLLLACFVILKTNMGLCYGWLPHNVNMLVYGSLEDLKSQNNTHFLRFDWFAVDNDGVFWLLNHLPLQPVPWHNMGHVLDKRFVFLLQTFISYSGNSCNSLGHFRILSVVTPKELHECGHISFLNSIYILSII